MELQLCSDRFFLLGSTDGIEYQTVVLLGAGLVGNNTVKEEYNALVPEHNAFLRKQAVSGEKTLTAEKEKLSGTNLVKAVSSAKSNINSWKDIIALVGGNLGAVDLASELGITDPSKVKTTNTVNNHTIKIDNVDLPSVTNANDFIKQLANLANKTIQTSAGR